MTPECIKKQRKRLFSECRELLININGSIQGGSQNFTALDDFYIPNPKDSYQIYNVCDCCQRDDIANEETFRIDSGQLLCPECLYAFNEALWNMSSPIQTSEVSDPICSTCDCCQRNNITNEEMFRIDSGQLMCPECLCAFNESLQDMPS